MISPVQNYDSNTIEMQKKLILYLPGHDTNNNAKFIGIKQLLNKENVAKGKRNNKNKLNNQDSFEKKK